MTGIFEGIIKFNYETLYVDKDLMSNNEYFEVYSKVEIYSSTIPKFHPASYGKSTLYVPQITIRYSLENSLNISFFFENDDGSDFQF